MSFSWKRGPEATLALDLFLLALHLGGLCAWAAAVAYSSAVLIASRRAGDDTRALTARRRVARAVALEHVALVAALLSGFALMALRGWGLGHARWLAVKVGLTVFVLVPLEGMHAWVSHRWIARGLRQTTREPLARDLERGIGMDDMVRAIAVPLLGVAIPLMLWLSLRKPF